MVGDLEGLRGFGFGSRKRDRISVRGKVRGRQSEWWAAKAGRENSEQSGPQWGRGLHTARLQKVW